MEPLRRDFDVDGNGLGMDGLGEDDEDSSGMRRDTLGGNMGSSGCRMEAWRRSDTKRGCGSVEK